MEDDDVPESIDEIETREDLEKFIREESGKARCKDDLVLTALWFIDMELTTVEDAIRTSDIEDRLGDAWDYNKYTILNKHLVEMDILDVLEPEGVDTFIIDEKTGKFLMGEDVDLAAHVDDYITQFIDHMQEKEAEEELVAVTDGSGDEESSNEEDREDEEDEPTTLRGVAAETLEVEPEEVKEEITAGDTTDRMNNLDDVVGAVKSSDEVEKRDDYDQIGFRQRANRYKLNDELAHLTEA